MRLWHYDLIRYLPDKLLKHQFKDCCKIAKTIMYKGKIHDHKVEYIFHYHYRDFLMYCDEVRRELVSRGCYLDDKACEDIRKYVLYSKALFINDEDPAVHIHPVFSVKHNCRYLMQCLYRIQELYDDYCITDEEYDRFWGGCMSVAQQYTGINYFDIMTK